jgi:hypothetical protein
VVKRKNKPPPAKERALDEIYAEIPDIPGCTGACASACGPIAMYGLEWQRVQRASGGTPRMRDPLRCPMLSPTGKCTVYTVRPYVCRLWGTTPSLRCPEGCEPERWLTREEAREIYDRLAAVAGPEITGPLGNVDNLWDAIALEAREHRAAIIEKIERTVNDGRDV